MSEFPSPMEQTAEELQTVKVLEGLTTHEWSWSGSQEGAAALDAQATKECTILLTSRAGRPRCPGEAVPVFACAAEKCSGRSCRRCC